MFTCPAGAFSPSAKNLSLFTWLYLPGILSLIFAPVFVPIPRVSISSCTFHVCICSCCFSCPDSRILSMFTPCFEYDPQACFSNAPAPSYRFVCQVDVFCRSQSLCPFVPMDFSVSAFCQLIVKSLFLYVCFFIYPALSLFTFSPVSFILFVVISPFLSCSLSPLFVSPSPCLFFIMSFNPSCYF